MLDKQEIESAANATAEIIKAVPVYNDAVQPVAKEIGKALGTLGGVINIALAPLSAMVYGYDAIGTQLKKRLETKLVNTPPENIVTPKLQVVGPLIEKYKYIHDNEELSQMFVNLLANAMDKNQIQKAHPSFVNVISELSPDEARLVMTISKEVTLPKIDINLKIKKGDKEGSVTHLRNFSILGFKASVDFPELTPSYLSNLERLMIIECSSGSLQDSYLNEDLYEPLENHPDVVKLKSSSTEDRKIEIVRGTIEVTDFGKMFMAAVL